LAREEGRSFLALVLDFADFLDDVLFIDRSPIDEVRDLLDDTEALSSPRISSVDLADDGRKGDIIEGRSDGIVDSRLFSRVVGFCNLDLRSFADFPDPTENPELILLDVDADADADDDADVGVGIPKLSDSARFKS